MAVSGMWSLGDDRVKGVAGVLEVGEGRRGGGGLQVGFCRWGLGVGSIQCGLGMVYSVSV